MYHRLIYITNVTAFSLEAALRRRQLHSETKSQQTQLVSKQLSSSHLKASSKRGHPTTFQRETRYEHTCKIIHTHTHTHTQQHTD